MRYRKKPVVIEAVCWTGPENEEVFEFMGGACRLTQENGKPQLAIPTLEGVMYANLWDWIIKGVKGEFYPCKPDIFEETYEEA